MLAVEGLTSGYGDVVAVSDLSFTIGSGEILGLIGANGAGKTSTIMSLAGLVPIRAGTVRLNGEDISGAPAHERVDHGLALVPEGRRVFADLTVDENLIVGAMRLETTRMTANRDQVFEIFPRLADRRRQPAGSLSGGEQQMLALGRAVMADPTILLVDELSLGLMPIAIDECYRVLDRLRKQGIAILLVEQSVDRVLDAADHIVVLEQGRLAWSGTGREAAEDDMIARSYLGLTDGH